MQNHKSVTRNPRNTHTQRHELGRERERERITPTVGNKTKTDIEEKV